MSSRESEPAAGQVEGLVPRCGRVLNENSGGKKPEFFLFGWKVER